MQLNHSTDLLFENLHQPGLAFRYGLEGAIEIRNAREKQLQRRELRRLEKKKMVKINKIADKYEITLTDLGRLEALKLEICAAEELSEEEDCVVVFDIPESKRGLRKNIREFLKEAGFFCIQRSVWVSRFDAGDALSQFFEGVGNQDWVRVYTAKRH